ncbi:MAG: phosphate signaling complex protein PhoU [Parvularculales bacterium]
MTETEHTVKAYGQKLDDIFHRISRMGDLATEQMLHSVTIIREFDNQQAKQIIATDEALDAMEKEVLEHITSVLALHQPMARDLRDIIAALQISSALERVGDMAKNIAKRMMTTQEQALPQDLLTPIAAMGEAVHGQLVKVMTAYSNRQTELAEDVWNTDEEIDKMHNTVFNSILGAIKGEQDSVISSWVHLLFISKNIERVGDYATNIAETITFMVGDEVPGNKRPKADVTSSISR